MVRENINIIKEAIGVTFRYDLLPSDVIDERALDRVKSIVQEGVAQVQYTEMEGKKTFLSRIPLGTVLSQFMKKEMNKAEVLTLLKKLLTAFDIGKSGIPVNYLVKDSDFIYVDEHTLDVYMFLVPVKDDKATVSDISDFFRDIVAGFKYSEADRDNYVARVLVV